MNFDWINFFESNNIEYVERGHGVGRLDIAGIQCPYCGTEGRPFHLVVSNKGWHCWRNSSFKGGSPHKLVMELLGCSFIEARRVVESGSASSYITDLSFSDDMFQKLGLKMKNERVANSKLSLLEEFTPITEGLARKFAFPYLNERGYSNSDICRLERTYDLHFALSGKFSHRIIIPIYYRGQLVTWTGRTIRNEVSLRYDTLEGDKSIRNIKDCLLDYDFLREGGKYLVVCEGPFDAMRVTYFGSNYGIMGTCLFGVSSCSDTQTSLLEDLSQFYQKTFALLDEGAKVSGIKMFPDYLNIENLFLPENVKDPGELDKKEFNKLFDIH